jgi:hypothetical protein
VAPAAAATAAATSATPLAVTAPSTLSITGSAPQAATVGAVYDFQPTVQLPSGATIGYSIQDKPGWASFNTVTGQLQGTPLANDVGIYPGIVISVSDGHGNVALNAFALTVRPSTSASAAGTATLAWVAPTIDSYGNPLPDLAGFRIYYGSSSSAMDNVIDIIADGNTGGFLVTGLPQGVYYFSVSAYDSAGVESVQSNMVSRSVS